MSQGTRPLSSSSPQPFRNARTAFPKATPKTGNLTSSRDVHVGTCYEPGIASECAVPGGLPSAFRRIDCQQGILKQNQGR